MRMILSPPWESFVCCRQKHTEVDSQRQTIKAIKIIFKIVKKWGDHDHHVFPERSRTAPNIIIINTIDGDNDDGDGDDDDYDDDDDDDKDVYVYVDADDVASSFGSQAAFRSQEKHSFSPNENNASSKTVRTLMKILTIITMVRF